MAGERGQEQWWRGVSPRQWLVLIVAWLGWVFDSMDSTLYVMIQKPALQDLLGASAATEAIGWYSGISISIFLIGWAIGGVFFGVVADYFGRARTMILTILIYSVFTGLAALSETWWHLALFRFVTALGVGGEWAAGATLIAETWPEEKRAKAAGIMQSAWAVGFFLAAFVNLLVGSYGWRVVLLIGTLPVIVGYLIGLTVDEPDRWRQSQVWKKEMARRGVHLAEERTLFSFTLAQIFSPGLARHTLVGSTLAFVAVFGLWGATNWTPDLTRQLLVPQHLDDETVRRYISYAAMSLNVGAIIGYLSFGPLADRLGRKPTFFLMCMGSLIMLPSTFLFPKDYATLLLLLPVLGFFNNGIFSGFPIYLPELYPTGLRATGSGFCFNVMRIIASSGPFLTGYLISTFGSYEKAVSLVGLIYLLGMGILLLAEETKGKALPE